MVGRWVIVLKGKERITVCMDHNPQSHTDTKTPPAPIHIRMCQNLSHSAFLLRLTSVWHTLGCLNKRISVGMNLLAGCLEGRCSLLLLMQAENKRSIVSSNQPSAVRGRAGIYVLLALGPLMGCLTLGS